MSRQCRWQGSPARRPMLARCPERLAVRAAAAVGYRKAGRSSVQRRSLRALPRRGRVLPASAAARRERADRAARRSQKPPPKPHPGQDRLGGGRFRTRTALAFLLPRSRDEADEQHGTRPLVSYGEQEGTYHEK